MRSGGCVMIIAMPIASYYQAKDHNADMKQITLESNAKSETRAKMQSKVQEQLNARNVKRTQAQVASAVTYERILASRTRQETARTRQNFVESRSTGNRYSRGNPV